MQIKMVGYQAIVLLSLIGIIATFDRAFGLNFEEYQSKATRYINSPLSREVDFKYVYGIEGNVSNPYASFVKDSKSSTSLHGVNSTISLDVGQITAGKLSFQAMSICDNTQEMQSTIGVAFAENADYAARDSDLSHSLKGGKDASLNFTLPCNEWKQVQLDDEHIRGSFRYTTFYVHDGSAIGLKNAQIQFNASPDVADNALGKYSGWFDSSDEVLNKIFYAGVYTIQLCRIGANTARTQPPDMPEFATGWNNSAPLPPLSPNDVAIIDGARRDRNVWPGDYAIAIPSSFYVQNHDNLASAKNGLRTLVALQNASTNMFPYAGPPLTNPTTSLPPSDTYHMWTLVGLYDYWRLSGDDDYLGQIWTPWMKGINASLSKIDDTGLFNVTATNDWGRIGTNSHNTQAQMILAGALQGGIAMANKLGKENESKMYNSYLVNLIGNITTRLWDDGKGAYKDNDTAIGAQVHPQDGNSLAIQFGVETNNDRRTKISQYLASLVNEYGSVSPEALQAISPFISSLQLQAHFLTGDNAAAYNLLRTMWGHMLQKFSNSTFVEGYNYDGSLHYPFYGNLDSYISHAHAWSTGPVTSLMASSVGLSNISSVQTDWVFSPAIVDSGLEYAAGGFNVPKVGNFSAYWSVSPNGNSYDATVEGPSQTQCTLKLDLPPTANGSVSDVTVMVDNEIMFMNGESSQTKNASFDQDSKQILIPAISLHKTIEVSVFYLPSSNFSYRASDPSPGRNVTASSSFARRMLRSGWGTSVELFE